MSVLLKTRIATIRQRAISEWSNYTVETLSPGCLFRLRHVSGDLNRVYYPNLGIRRCNCEAWKKEGYCKHCAIAQIATNQAELEEAGEPTTVFEAWLAKWAKVRK